MHQVLLATSNPGKLAELQALLSPIQCIPQDALHLPAVAETGLSFIENAIIKARHASYHSGKPALADDSGLVVEALNGQPGIYSARFAGKAANDQENISLLLKKMAEIPDDARQAYFYCAIAIVRHADDPTPLIATGECWGTITHTQQGDQGFGYDPVFYVAEHQCTFAQLSKTAKNKISHRGKALQKIASQFTFRF